MQNEQRTIRPGFPEISPLYFHVEPPERRRGGGAGGEGGEGGGADKKTEPSPRGEEKKAM